ncbi:MAG: bifunctional UDP-N-acetylglucosamine diphosphorylase/glucosamine-1-phosphate N-acetyltransferase GlmU [Desulfovibrionaceae bacterium]
MTTGAMGALILAAGKGTRMYSDRPKVLRELLGEPMLRYVRDALAPLFADRLFTVIGFGADAVRAAFAGVANGWVVQERQLGTGHALQAAWDALRGAGVTQVVVVNGDTPLITQAHVADFAARAQDADVAFMTLTLAEPGGFGRVVREEGRIVGIVEAKDYDAARHGPATGEINAGVYCLRLDAVEPLLGGLSPDNNSGEYYITDLVGMAVASGLNVVGVSCGHDPCLLGINSPRELAAAEALLRGRIVDQALDAGVVIHAPESVRIGPGVVLEPGAELCGPCELYGSTRIARGAVVMSHTWVKDSAVGAGSEIRPFSHLDGARVAAGCLVGPYARLRPGAVLEDGSRVGNFVEMKKAVLGKGAKASHLTYLGDAEIGAGSNIGAGTITCNYDGKNKFKTVLEENVFIGSNTALVAPVTVGKGALVGAGSVITKDVPAGQMAIARGKQKNLPRRREP